MGFTIVGLVGSGWLAGQIPNDPEKTDEKTLAWRSTMMHYHESFGLLMLAAIVPRIAIRFMHKAPKQLPGPAWEHLAGNLSHAALYGAMIFMPVSGLAFGYYSCWGVPFFAWNVPGLPKEQYDERAKAIEDFFYTNHHRVGQVLEYLVPLHIGAVGYHHLLRGHNLLGRMNPFAAKVVSETAKKV